MLTAQVLGAPTQDNALLVQADSGQRRTRLLLDCGADVLRDLPFSDILGIDHLLFSHLHMDHVCGFDAFFRATFDRRDRANHVWGPPGTIEAIHHRFRGYWWNHAADLRASWWVHDIDEREVRSARFEAQEAFVTAHDAGTCRHDGVVLTTAEVNVRALRLQHHGVSLGYVLREPERQGVDVAALTALGLRPGPWLAQLKSGATGAVDIAGCAYDAATLRAALLVTQPGDSIAYLTDFLLKADEHERLRAALADLRVLYAEAQYAPEDNALAQKHHHTTVTQVAALARDAGVHDLQLIHLSRRYRRERWPELLLAARAQHVNTSYPEGWLDEPTASGASG